ncbi:uncharacterized protein A4U43_C05F8880 [Asparagus officinalis]|uniref:Elongation factor Ts, mitochondrial n=1 Tax=Asparagus officinalis TaxID=4686 RepID=A0A5P1EQX7_ASPOF|nr:uncharacterized protein A4U43_C05F8880 [Asparagus officinalis]
MSSKHEELTVGQAFVEKLLNDSLARLDEEKTDENVFMRWELGACWIQHLQDQKNAEKEKKPVADKDKKHNSEKTKGETKIEPSKSNKHQTSVVLKLDLPTGSCCCSWDFGGVFIFVARHVISHSSRDEEESEAQERRGGEWPWRERSSLSGTKTLGKCPNFATRLILILMGEFDVGEEDQALTMACLRGAKRSVVFLFKEVSTNKKVSRSYTSWAFTGGQFVEARQVGNLPSSLRLMPLRRFSSEVSAAEQMNLIRQLREKTSAPIKDVKSSLVSCNWDIEAAQKDLRKRGVVMASKKSSRTAAEGLLSVAQTENKAVVVELNCETDFVARNDIFQYMALSLARTALMD